MEWMICYVSRHYSIRETQNILEPETAIPKVQIFFNNTGKKKRKKGNLINLLNTGHKEKNVQLHYKPNTKKSTNI